jgi:two-component system NtrC family sensor kinase
MKLRAGLIATGLSTGMSAILWLSLQPMLAAARQALRTGGGFAADLAMRRIEALLPVSLAVGALLGGVLAYRVLVLSWTRTVVSAERALERLVRGEDALAAASGLEGEPALEGPLQSVLRRVAEALSGQRERSRRQLVELRASHSALQTAQTQLVAADRLATVGKLAAGVAHEVGNPLSGILGYLSILRSRQDATPEVTELVGLVEREVERIDQVVRALLELGRPSRGSASAIDVRPIIDSCVKLLASAPEFRHMSVAVQAPGALYLRAEAGPLSQVLVNLLLNAAHAMEGTGELVIRAKADLEAGKIEILDTGPGLSEEVQLRLFEPFFTTKPPGQGTGLGLAVSRQLVTQFGGALLGANRPEGGAVFSIWLALP